MKRKNNLLTLLLLLIMVSANSCKSASRLTHSEKTLHNILALDLLANKESIDSKAIIVNEEVSSSLDISAVSPWKVSIEDFTGPRSVRISKGPYEYWKTIVRSTIKLFVDDINNESFAEITYWEPKGSYSTLIKDIKCWVSEMREEGLVTKQVLTKNEIHNNLLNDSTRKVTFKIDGNLNGKILDYEYTLLSPYKSFIPTNLFPDVAQIPIHSFQRDIPIMRAQYQIELPSYESGINLKNEIEQIGEGVLDIKKSKGKRSLAYSYKPGTDTMNKTGRVSYSYITYTITAEDIPAFRQSNNKSGKPLGVQVIRLGQLFKP